MNIEIMTQRLIALRGKRTQEEVSRALGISKSALSMYEKGQRVPRDEIKIRIARYYEQSIESIFLIKRMTRNVMNMAQKLQKRDREGRAFSRKEETPLDKQSLTKDMKAFVDGGDGGSGGKILDVTLTGTIGSTVTYSCGTGGGAAVGDNGSNGGNGSADSSGGIGGHGGVGGDADPGADATDYGYGGQGGHGGGGAGNVYGGDDPWPTGGGSGGLGGKGGPGCIIIYY